MGKGTWLARGALSCALLLSGCAASTHLVTNEKLSEATKAKGYKSYHEVLLLGPKDDSRHVVPRIVQEIQSLGFQVKVLDPEKPVEPSQGTAFVVNREGWLVTCAHVLGDEKQATITLDGERLLAEVVKADKQADMALLKVSGALPATATALPLRVGRPAVMGDDVFTIGYPLSRMLGNNARMTKGLLSATTGLRDDDKQVQVSAEIQPGNSGGPLLDRDGAVIGIINQTLSPAAVVQATGGALPQNVNFAIKAGVLADFLATAADGKPVESSKEPAPGLQAAGHAVAKVQAGVVGPDSDRQDKMLVRLTYVSMWDMWYRFRLFALTAFDYQTQEPLFVAGQFRDNLVSDEDVVIRKTMDEFRKAVSAN